MRVCGLTSTMCMVGWGTIFKFKVHARYGSHMWSCDLVISSHSHWVFLTQAELKLKLVRWFVRGRRMEEGLSGTVGERVRARTRTRRRIRGRGRVSSLLTYCIPTDEFIMSVPRRYYAHKILVTNLV